ncbi:MAG TPA: hypothetical protein VK550_32170 [Polyangiaceae bacterium]|nr:hypothetical protein [Polyangiaceae bacterium]
MAAPIVLVQGLPPRPDLRSSILAACSEALKHRSCVAADDQDQGAPPPSATALISWPEGTDRHVRVTLERFEAQTPRRIERDTRFADEDPIVERWRTIGLVIAALVCESEALRDGGAESESQAERGLSSGSGAHAPRWIGLAALAGPGLDDGSVRLGAAIDGAMGFRSSPLFVSASASYALRPIDDFRLDVRWTTFAVGGGAQLPLPSVDAALRVRVELMLEYLRASSASGAAASGGGSRVSPGIRGGGAIRWPASSPLGMMVGFSVWSLPGGTAIQLDQRKLGSSRWLSYAASLGAEWSFR